MITSLLKGGLGNQLFIIFTTLAYGIQNKMPVLFYYSDYTDKKRKTYWNTLFYLLLPITIKAPFPKTLNRIKEVQEGLYTPLEKVQDDAALDGYFQSEKYFRAECGEISRMIGIYYLRYKKRQKFQEAGIFPEKTISLHFRLGDYKHIGPNAILPLSYYSESIQWFSKRHPSTDTILYFYEMVDHQDILPKIAVLQNEFPCYRFISIQDSGILNKEECTDYNELIVMSICRNHIIANSTFSWWAAYIGSKEDYEEHDVSYPSGIYFMEYPKEWTKIDYSKDKL
jgi:hypothetical protein